MGAREDLPEALEASAEDVLMAKAPQSECVQLHGGGGELHCLPAQAVGQPPLSIFTQELQILPQSLHVHVVYLLLQSYWGYMQRYTQRGLGHLSVRFPCDRSGG